MKSLKNIISYFNHVWPLLALQLLILGYNGSPKNLTELLYELAEIDVEDRAGYLEDWLKMQDEFPVIDGNEVYFIFKEKRDVPVFLVGDMTNDNSEQQLLKIIGTDYYYTKQTYPLDCGFEYKFIVGGRHYLDPLNKRIIKNKTELRSLLFMPEYIYPVESLTRINKGYTKLDTISYKNDVLYTYRHPKAVTHSPIIYFLNGKEYLEFAEANIILDNLIDDYKIVPCFAVFLNKSADILNLFSHFKREFNLDGGQTIIGGNKNAGLMLFQNPEICKKFNSIFIQSGFSNVKNLVFLSNLSDIDFLNKNIFLSYGHFENQDTVYNKVIDFFKNKTAHFKYEKYSEGASWLSWKGHLDNVLIYFLKQGNQANL